MGDGRGDKLVLGLALLCRKFEEWKLSHPSSNTQQQVSRITVAVTQQRLMEPRSPLDDDDGQLWLQVVEDNYNMPEFSSPIYSSRDLVYRTMVAEFFVDMGVGIG